MSQHRRLGATGVQVFPICCDCGRVGGRTGGGLKVDRDQAHARIDAYDEAGGNCLGSANTYRQPGGGPRTGTSEEYVGEWLATRDRDHYVLASEVYIPVGDGPNGAGLSRRQVRDEMEETPLTLRWLVDHPLDPVPVVGGRTPGQMCETPAAHELSLGDDQRERITAASAEEVTA